MIIFPLAEIVLSMLTISSYLFIFCIGIKFSHAKFSSLHFPSAINQYSTKLNWLWEFQVVFMILRAG
jgi:hypothetical protein